jgi:molecular chaperone HtpG
MSSAEQIVFEVETSRILEILSKEIYDSPNALLRENLQNAYDAVLMRCAFKGCDIKEMVIDISVEPNRLTITDSGIGMTEEVLRSNFWKAGSSGKRTDLATRAGVIGTFGIGAMANFGVCTRLIVETRYVDSDITLISTAERDKLSISKECIDLEIQKDERSAGTKLIAYIDTSYQLNESNAHSYLEPYVQFLPVRVLLNGKLISQKSFENVLTDQIKGYEHISSQEISHSIYSGMLSVSLNSSGNALIRFTNIKMDNTAIVGELFLIQNRAQIMGLRNFFGLAPVPISGHYQFGGFANLSILNPTAGREALSRESIQHVNNLIVMIEAEVSKNIAESSAADKNLAFMNYILANNQISLAKKVMIEVLPTNESVQLGQIQEHTQGKGIHYYTGRDQAIIQTFSSDQSYLLHASQNNPRRKIQIQYITQILGLPAVPDQATIIEEYAPTQLTIEEAALQIKIISILNDDYLVPKAEVSFAKISHGVTFLINYQDDILQIKLARDSSAVQSVLECYRTAYEVFEGFVKDFIRNYLYQRIAPHVPSSTKEGADALYKILRRNRELYRYEESEHGYLEPLLADYLSGDITLGEVLKTAKSKAQPQSQRVERAQVGQVEQEIPDIVESPPMPKDEASEGREYEPAPSIMRTEVISSMKILTTNGKYPQLNNYELFLGLSDRLFKREGEFFRWPHTTKIIWAAHRVTYIFTDASNSLTLYYDIELKDSLGEKAAHGGMLPTTTIFTKNRIFVPVPKDLEPSFRISDGYKEFFVRFDTIIS